MTKRVQNPIHSVFIPETVSKTCKILENDPVLIKTQSSMVVKRAMLVNDDIMASASLTKNGIIKKKPFLIKFYKIYFL